MTPPVLTRFDHVGIRVVDRARSLSFYDRLGFAEDRRWSSERVAEVVNLSGLRLNLIFNGRARLDRKNVLMDVPAKRPGFTHAAFVTDSLERLIDLAVRHRIAITEGPVDWGRRITCFLRDPDGNVLEFNELRAAGGD